MMIASKNSRATDDAVDATLHQFTTHTVHDTDFAAMRDVPWLGDAIKTVVDAGANRGQTIASILAILPGATIHSFEANPFFFSILEKIRAVTGPQVHVYHSGLGDRDAVLPFYIPSVNGEEFLEEATLCLDIFDKPWVKSRYEARGTIQLKTIEVEIRKGDDFALAPDLLKVDVEGFELPVLTGFAHTIGLHQPVLLVENSDYHNVTAYLAPLGYRAYQYFAASKQLRLLEGACVNTFYLPQRLQQFVAVS